MCTLSAEGGQPALQLGSVQILALDDEGRAVAIARELLMDRVDPDTDRLHGRVGQRLASHGRRDTAHDLEQAGATRIDDPGLPQDIEELRRLLHRALAPRNDSMQELAGGQRVEVRLLCLLGHLADHRQHGSFDRLRHRPVRGIARRAERGRQLGAAGELVAAEHVGEAADDLAEDDAGVSARAHQRRPRHLLRNILRARGLRRVECLGDRSHGEREIRARVTVGDRVDIEVVDAPPMGLEVPECRVGELARALDLDHDLRPRFTPRG
jgi:hypothetical protein